MHEFDLEQTLRSLSTQNISMPRSQEIEAQILGEFDRREGQRTLSLWRPALALAIAASLAALGFLHDLHGRPAAPAPKQVVFYAIPYTIPPAPYEHTTVVRMNVEVAALIAAGFHVEALDAGASVPAEVLLAQDGRAVAIRPLTQPVL